MESAVLKSDYENVATATTVEDMTVEMQAFLAMRQMGMGEISYEQYLRTYGVKSVNMREVNPNCFPIGVIGPCLPMCSIRPPALLLGRFIGVWMISISRNPNCSKSRAL